MKQRADAYKQFTEFVLLSFEIYKVLGFATHDDCKRFIIEHFTEDADYEKGSFFEKWMLVPIDLKGKPVSFVDPFSRNEEGKWQLLHSHDNSISLTIQTYKNTAMLSNTTEGKKIRNFYMKIEDIIFD
jgi:hypothetical protein